MRLEEKIKMLAESRVLGISKLHRIGASYGIIVPKRWVEFNLDEVDGDYYLTLDVVDNTLVIKPIDKDELESVVVKEKE